MKVNQFKSKVLAAIALLAIALTLSEPLTPQARAQNAQSFNGTNYFLTGTSLYTWPTNGSGTNTGTGILVDNYNNLGFYVSGDLTCSNVAAISFSLIRAIKATSGRTNWETTNQAAWKIVVPLPVQTNTFTWATNLPADFAGAAVKVGVLLSTNSLLGDNILTNADFGLGKKIIPFRYP